MGGSSIFGIWEPRNGAFRCFSFFFRVYFRTAKQGLPSMKRHTQRMAGMFLTIGIGPLKTGVVFILRFLGGLLVLF